MNSEEKLKLIIQYLIAGLVMYLVVVMVNLALRSVLL